MIRIGEFFSLKLGPRRGRTVRVGKREITPLAFILHSHWAGPRGYQVGGYVWTYPLAIEVKDGPSTSLRFIPDVTRLALLACAILGFSLARRAGNIRGGKR